MAQSAKDHGRGDIIDIIDSINSGVAGNEDED